MSVTPFARTNARAPFRAFGLLPGDRLAHVHVIGRTGVGKSTLLARMMEGDIAAGQGFALLDPHGDLALQVAAAVPPARRRDLVYLDIAEPRCPYRYNPLRRVAPELRPLVVSGVLEVFHKLWPEAWGVRMEHLLRQSLYTLLEQPRATMPDILRLFRDRPYRRAALARVTHAPVCAFWTEEWARYQPRQRSEALAPIENKVGAFLADPRLHRLLAGDGEDLRLRRIMDEGRILIVNLNKGVLGEDSAALVGGLLMTSLSLAGLSRGSLPEPERRPFFVYVDEFQSVTTTVVANMTAELRKFGVGMVLANQFLAQLDETVRDAVLANAGTLLAFRLGPHDAAVLARELEPVFTPHDLMNLPNRDLCVKLLVRGAPLRPFSATALPPGSVWVESGSVQADTLLSDDRQSSRTPVQRTGDVVSHDAENAADRLAGIR